jgi:hypothetical protein
MMTTMATELDTAKLAEQIAYGRIGLGLALMIAPGLAGRGYIGRRAGEPTVRLVNRLFGGRDVALGVWLLASRRDKDAFRTAVAVGAACDAWDGVATLTTKDALPRLGRFMTATTAFGAAAAGALALRGTSS